MRYTKGSFCVVPANQIKGLNPCAQTLYMWLCYHSNTDGVCYPSITTLSEECGMSKRTVVRMTKLLIEKGLLIKNSRMNGEEFSSNIYQILISDTTPSDTNALGSDTESLGVVTQSHTNYIHTEPDLSTHNNTSGTRGADVENMVLKKPEKEKDKDKKEKSHASIPYDQIISMFNETVAHATSPVPICRIVSNRRKTLIAARWRKELPDIQAWEKYFKIVAKSRWLMGMIASKRTGEYCRSTTIDWLLNETNCVKVLEYTYSRD